MATAQSINTMFGQALATARKARGLTQDNLASRVSLSRQTIARIEGGHRVSLEHALELSHALGVRLVDLLGEDVQVGDRVLSAVEVRYTLGSHDPFGSMLVVQQLIEEARREQTERTLISAAAIWQQAPGTLRDLFAQIIAELN